MQDHSSRDSQLDSLPKIIHSIPQECFQSSVVKSMLYVIRDYAIVLGCAYLILLADSWLIGPFVAIVMGAGLGGLFVIGHDAGHRSFCKSKKVNNFIGHLTTSPVLWPFHIWRMDHDNHHRNTSHVDKDPAWRPTTYKLWKRMPKFQKFVYRWIRSGFFFMGSFYTTYQLIKEGLKADQSTRLSDQEKKEVKFSLRITMLAASAFAFATIYFGGLYGFVCLFLIPQCIFHFLLSTFTYFHHTHPDLEFLSRKDWTPETAQLRGSIHLAYPRILESLTHDINWHVPHHVCVGIPHYHLRRAHQSLKEKYPKEVKEYVFSWEYLRNVVTQCHFIASRSRAAPDLSWVSYEQAKMAEEGRKNVKPFKPAIKRGSEA